MKKLFSILSGIGLSILTSCTSIQYAADYKMEISTIKKTVDGNNIKIDSTKIDKLNFNDSLIDIGWLPSSKGFSFELTNKTQNTLKVNWDEAVFINTNGYNGKIMHNGVRFIERNSSMPLTSIIGQSKLSDIIIPTENIYWRDGYYSQYGSSPGGWEVSDIYVSSDKDSILLSQSILLYKNSEIRILLPLKIENKSYNYIFGFKFKDAEIRPIEVNDPQKSAVASVLIGLGLGLVLCLILLQ